MKSIVTSIIVSCSFQYQIFFLEKDQVQWHHKNFSTEIFGWNMYETNLLVDNEVNHDHWSNMKWSLHCHKTHLETWEDGWSQFHVKSTHLHLYMFSKYVIFSNIVWEASTFDICWITSCMWTLLRKLDPSSNSTLFMFVYSTSFFYDFFIRYNAILMIAKCMVHHIHVTPIWSQHVSLYISCNFLGVAHIELQP